MENLYTLKKGSSLMEKIDVYFLGNYKILLNNENITTKFSKKALGLLCYLIMNNDKFHYREKLASMFWENYKRESGYSNLRYALWQIRKVFKKYTDEEVIIAKGKNVISISKDLINSDVNMYLDFIKQSNEVNISLEEKKNLLISASKLYKGDFIENFYIYDISNFNDWFFNEREYLQRMYFDVQLRLSDIYIKQKEIRAAITELNKLIAIDSLNEEVYYRVIKYQYMSGNRASAINTYKKLKLTLRNELNISPSSEIQGLYNKIITENDTTNLSSNNFSIRHNNLNKGFNRINKSMKIFISDKPDKLKKFSRLIYEFDKSSEFMIIDICISPGSRINYEGIYEMLDGFQAFCSEKSTRLYRNFSESIDEIRNITTPREYSLFKKMIELFSSNKIPDILIKVWNFHLIDEKSIDFISFLFRKIDSKGINLIGIYDLRWNNERLNSFIRAFENEKFVEKIRN